jgi:hypothetical protein
MSLLLKDVIQGGYKDPKKQQKNLAKSGYIKDHDLSTKKSQVFYNPATNTLLKNTNGTQDLGDWKTNFAVATGTLHKTDRYEQEKNQLEKARKKYHPDNIYLTGSSLGGKLSAELGKRQLKGMPHHIYSVNRPSLPFESIGNNETHYRVKGDPVSIFNTNAKHTQLIPKTNVPSSIYQHPMHSSLLMSAVRSGYNSHSVDNLKKQSIG